MRLLKHTNGKLIAFAHTDWKNEIENLNKVLDEMWKQRRITKNNSMERMQSNDEKGSG